MALHQPFSISFWVLFSAVPVFVEPNIGYEPDVEFLEFWYHLPEGDFD